MAAMRGYRVAMVMAAVLGLGLCQQQQQPQQQQQQQRQAPMVQTRYGLARGKVDQDTFTFMGIPYAVANRFDDPRPPAAWSGVRDFLSPGPQCPQDCSTPLAPYVCVPQESEDCLTVNVHVPERFSGELLPVMVWFHGGNFEFGSGGALIYNGAFLARVGRVVVVTCNYRMGSFGYLPVFDNATGRLEGNWGLKDQIAALQWVHDNIQAFGGNPNKVTIFGQSAGGQSVGALMTSPVTEKLFDYAIMQSAPFTLPFRNYRDAQVLAKTFADAINCPVNDLNCYRQRPAKLLVSKHNAVRSAFSYKAPLSSQPWGPVVDGRLVMSSLTNAFKTGNFHRKPLMLGYTTEEGLTYAKQLSKDPLLPSVYRLMLTMLLPGDVGQRASEGPYRPPPTSRDVRPTLARAITDLIFACPARWVARRTSEARVPTFLYVFDQPITQPGLWGNLLCEGRTCHAVDLPFLFNSVRLIGTPMAYEDYRLSYDMARRWTRFAWSGNPNEGEFVGSQSWPAFRFTAPGPVKMAYVFRHGTRGAESGHLDRYCNFWDQMGYTALGDPPSSTPATAAPSPSLPSGLSPSRFPSNPSFPQVQTAFSAPQFFPNSGLAQTLLRPALMSGGQVPFLRQGGSNFRPALGTSSSSSSFRPGSATATRSPWRNPRPGLGAGTSDQGFQNPSPFSGFPVSRPSSGPASPPGFSQGQAWAPSSSTQGWGGQRPALTAGGVPPGQAQGQWSFGRAPGANSRVERNPGSFRLNDEAATSSSTTSATGQQSTGVPPTATAQPAQSSSPSTSAVETSSVTA